MPPQRTQLTMVGLDVSVQLARVIGDLDVHWRQPVVVVPRFTALVHACLRIFPAYRLRIFSMSLCLSV